MVIFHVKLPEGRLNITIYNYGKSPSLMGKLTILCIFNSYFDITREYLAVDGYPDGGLLKLTGVKRYQHN